MNLYFSHERLDVYNVALNYVAYIYTLVTQLNGHNRYARDQLLRASQSIPLNIAEGNGKATEADRRRIFEIARRSARECAATQNTDTESDAEGDCESEQRGFRIASC